MKEKLNFLFLIGNYHNSSEPVFEAGCVGAAPTFPAKINFLIF